MKRTTITIPDDLESRINEHARNQGVPPSLDAVVQAALEEYLERQKVHGLRQPRTVTPPDQMADLSERRSDTNHDTNRVNDRTVDLPRSLLFEEMAQEDLDKVPRVLKITPAEKGSGLSDVSINHDK